MTSVRPVIFDSTLDVMAPAADCGAGFAGIWGIAASILSLNCEAGMAAKVLRAVSMRVISCVVASRIVVKSPLVERPLFPFMRKEDDLPIACAQTGEAASHAARRCQPVAARRAGWRVLGCPFAGVVLFAGGASF